jgi:hypothetical protein
VARPFISSIDPTYTPDAQEGLVYLFFPGSIVDFPVAVAIDTLLLPYDIYKLRKKRSDEIRQDSTTGSGVKLEARS